MAIKLVILDMDGTLADTSPGILESYRFVADALGVPRPNDAEMFSRMGGTLQENLSRIYNLDEDGTRYAADIYREYYGREGFLMAELYPGIPELLQELKSRGIPVSIATMKIAKYAEQQVRNWGLEGMFQSVNGSDAQGVLTKADIIMHSLDAAGVRPGEAVMIGDTVNDQRGAESCGVPFIGVTYGYGLTVEMCERSGIRHVGSPEELMGMLFPEPPKAV